jgi:hypothetical protein
LTTINKSLALLYFFSGLLCGLFIGVSLGQAWSDAVGRFLSAGTIIVIAFFWRRIELFAHKRYLENWPLWKSRGKWRFVFTEYVLIRGAVIYLAIAGPMLPAIALTMYTVGILLISVVALAALLAYLGSEAWAECEQNFEIQGLRKAAEQSRIESN